LVRTSNANPNSAFSLTEHLSPANVRFRSCRRPARLPSERRATQFPPKRITL